MKQPTGHDQTLDRRDEGAGLRSMQNLAVCWNRFCRLLWRVSAKQARALQRQFSGRH